ncbi:uncharacterized protein VTP21DRAFT_2739 [Calcarisporiella thermophila]|uniref:uncharacterized protein n=1 Tax=Calcarisporiella thermophila TaxID=911321 RepID=UPI0037437BBA
MSTLEIPSTLTELLQRAQLEQCLPSLIDAGVRDNDVWQIISWDEEDLRELLDAAGIKPFHAIALRRYIREIRTRLGPDALTDTLKSCVPQKRRLNSHSLPTLVPAFRKSVSAIESSTSENEPIPHSSLNSISDVGSSQTVSTVKTPGRNGVPPQLVKSASISEGNITENSTPRRKLSLARVNAVRSGYAQQRSIDRARRIALLERQLEQKKIELKIADAQVQRCLGTTSECFEKEEKEPNNSKELELARSHLMNLQLERDRIHAVLTELKTKERKHQWYQRKRGRDHSTDIGNEDEHLMTSQPEAEPSSTSVGEATQQHEDEQRAALQKEESEPESNTVEG